MVNHLLTIKKIKEGDIDEFERLFKQLYSPLLLFSISIVKDRDIAEDIVQDIFYNIWRDRERLNIFTSIKSYLYKSTYNNSIKEIIRNQVKDRYKTEQDIISNEGNRSIATELLEMKDLERVVIKSISKMPQRRAEIFRLHRFSKMKYSQIAQTYDLSIKTIEAEISKAIKTVEKEIEQHFKHI